MWVVVTRNPAARVVREGISRDHLRVVRGFIIKVKSERRITSLVGHLEFDFVAEAVLLGKINIQQTITLMED